uniref:Uncharacterized protein n=1 Tax=Romanomermis culicivorax TaxID=13658 RepID=A0A915KSN3_ROMCU
MPRSGQKTSIDNQQICSGQQETLDKNLERTTKEFAEVLEDCGRTMSLRLDDKFKSFCCYTELFYYLTLLRRSFQNKLCTIQAFTK